ncbi:MAG: hypothetical protein R6V40_02510 [Candidatus Moraniibacteriota bacterium]
MNNFKATLVKNRKKISIALFSLNVIAFLALLFCIIKPGSVTLLFLYVATASFCIITIADTFFSIAINRWEKESPEYRKEVAIEKAKSILEYENPNVHLQKLVNEVRYNNRNPQDLEDWLDKYRELRDLERALSKVPRWRMREVKLKQELGIERK